MRIKICGITTSQDADLAIQAGADALGFNFVGGPRQLAPAAAEPILSDLPPLISPVALIRLTKGEDLGRLLDMLRSNRVHHLQLYGAYPPEDLARISELGFFAITVLSVRDADFYREADNWLSLPSHQHPAAILLDAHDPRREGGTGKPFRWDWVTQARDQHKLDHWPPILLAGGLNPSNVAEAVKTVQPYGLDVSSGVEQVDHPGSKDPQLVRDFIRNARNAALAL